jgi:hypothetical protein
MQEKAFIECSFANDTAKYIGDITHVDTNTFDCRFLNSGELYTFDSETMKVTSLGGTIPIGTQMASYIIYTVDTSQNFQSGGYVVVTFEDGSRQLGQLTDVDASGNKSVAFLDSGSKYVFGSDNTIISTDDVKQVAAVTAIESYSAGAPVIVVPGADAGSGNALNTSANINRFIPQSSDTIVVNMQEFPSGITNFKNWSTNAALHNTNAKTVRKSSAIRFILLHETSGGDGGSGFDPPYTSHFVVATDEIRQFNDLCEIE